MIDLTRLTDTGSKIILLNNQIESDWLRVKSLNVSSLNRAYAKFLYFILQDTEEAFSILEKFFLLICLKITIKLNFLDIYQVEIKQFHVE